MTKANTQLQQDVMQELKFEPSVDASDIGVMAKDGIVSLAGNVKNYAEKFAAVRAAERVSGVRAVTDEMKVDLPSTHVRNDQDIAKAALNALEWDVYVPSKQIQVKVDDGWVTIGGEVDHKYQKDAAEFALRNLIGVRGVANLISIKKPAVKSFDVKATIENALQRAAELDAEKIRVEVDGDRVVLRGDVHSWAERGEAERAAWSTPGVTRVDDNLVVAV